jgi:hypothetical protein
VDVFDQIRRVYEAMKDSGAFDMALCEWNNRNAAFQEVHHFEELERFCRDSAADRYDLRDEVIGALCSEAMRDERARILLCGLFLPGLLDVRKRFTGQTVLPGEDLDAEILANFWITVRAVASDATRISQRLLNAAVWSTTRTLRRAARWNQHEELVENPEKIVEILSPMSPDDRESRLASDEAVRELLAQAVAEGVLSEMDAGLLDAPRGTYTERAIRLGLTSRNGRTRRRVARKRLRAWMKHRIE